MQPLEHFDADLPASEGWQSLEHCDDELPAMEVWQLQHQSGPEPDAAVFVSEGLVGFELVRLSFRFSWAVASCCRPW